MYFNNRYSWIRTTFSSIGYISCAIIQSLIGSGKLPDLLGRFFSVNGCLSVVSFAFVMFIILGSNAKHFYVALLLQCINAVYMLFPIVFQNNLNPLPGLTLTVLSILISFILTTYIKYISEGEIKLNKMLYTDNVTNLLNKTGLLKEMHIKGARGEDFYLALIDLNDFRRINDITNQEEGDSILKMLAQSWSNTFSSTIFSYLGGCVFAVVFTGSKQEMDNLVKGIYENIQIISTKNNVLITASIGIAHHTKDTVNIDQLITYADAAMIVSKEQGKNIHTYFDADSYKAFTKRYLTEKDVRNALLNDSFELVYQPQFALKGKKLVGFEALLRMRDSNGNFVSTQEFIDISEKSGLIYEIDLWVIKNVLLQTTFFIKERPDVEFSINVSGKHISLPGFVDYVVKCLDLAHYNPENLKIEITESSYIRDFDEAIKSLNKLKSLGIKIALDDFGTGYSSLSYLARLPSDILKIDKSFIDNINIDQGQCNFVDIIIKLGHIMGNMVIAEGVEDPEQLAILSFLGCDYIQGYVWGKPIGINELNSVKEGFQDD